MPEPMPAWDPGQYLRHWSHRARAFADLLAHVPEPPSASDRPPRIADLGCGPGATTALLAGRWPTARITGLDNSPQMLERARRDHAGGTAGGGRIDFAYADATVWTPAPDEPYDLIISNAALQWVPGHSNSFAAWIDGLASGGTFAFQVPANFDEPSHALMRELAESPRWRNRIAGKLRHSGAVLGARRYLDQLAELDCVADVWETTYLHLLQGPDPVLDWVRGTGLRPVLAALADDPQASEAFVTQYRDALRQAYPPAPYGTVLPFPRLFAVAVKRAPGREPERNGR